MKYHQHPTNSTRHALRLVASAALLACAAQASASVTNPAIGKLLWSEEFNGSSLNTSLWRAYNGNGCEIGLCGFGNAELQYYSPNAVSIRDVPFEPGTRALALQASRQAVGNNPFTSGKVDTKGKVQIQYGMVEVRLSTPAVGTGLWPAAWMLGVSPQTWPRNGEIDIMEMGHQAQVRAAANNAPINNFVGSNVITYQQAACVPGNESCAAMTAWQTKNWYVSSAPLVNRFVTYRLYWDESQMRFTVNDGGTERNMYNAPLPVNSPALQAPYYLLLNLAVGGTFTDALNASQVTAPLPSTMYVDYVRVYEMDGKGAVKVGDAEVPEAGKFGVFTDSSSVNNKLVAGTTSDIFVWNPASVSAGNSAPYEGANVIAWNYTAPNQWFGGSVQARVTRDMANFRNGTLKFRIKVPANVPFTIAVKDTYGNEGKVNFPANTTAYGLVRNGAWGQATIPFSALLGTKLAAQSMADLFMISSPGASNTFQMAIDDIVYDSGVVSSSPSPASSQTTWVNQASATSLQFNVKTASWADLHYTVNGGAQQNVRMRQAGGLNSFVAGGLRTGDVVRYWFTYWDAARSGAVDTTQAGYTMK